MEKRYHIMSEENKKKLKEHKKNYHASQIQICQ